VGPVQTVVPVDGRPTGGMRPATSSPGEKAAARRTVPTRPFSPSRRLDPLLSELAEDPICLFWI